MKKIFTYAFVFMVTAATGIAQDKLPDLTLSDVNGNKINVADYSTDGKIQVFSFWATWCVPCKEELNNIAEMYAEWQEDYNVEIIAVSVDDAKTRAQAKSYAEGQGWTYTILLDTNKDLQRLLGGQSVPFTVITDKAGNIVDKHTGYIEGDEYELEDKIAKLAK